MQIMYIDESGDTISLSQGGKKFLILTGCVINESDKVTIESSFRDIKQKYYQNPEVELKSNFLRYANPDLTQSSPIKLNDRQKYDELEVDVATFLKNIPVTVFSVVIDKVGYWKQYPSQNPYEIAYIFLLERFQIYLNAQKALGICIIDPREGQVEKSYIGPELDRIHSLLRWNENGFWQKCPNIIERVLFSTSDKTVGIQITDLYCYPVFHVFEYDKKKEAYWRYHDVTYPKLHRKGNQVDGIGLKFFPEATKKDLAYFK